MCKLTFCPSVSRYPVFYLTIKIICLSSNSSSGQQESVYGRKSELIGNNLVVKCMKIEIILTSYL